MRSERADPIDRHRIDVEALHLWVRSAWLVERCVDVALGERSSHGEKYALCATDLD